MYKIHPNDVGSSPPTPIHGRHCKPCATTLTVWKKSLVLSCHGFTVYDSEGDLVFRVDNYGPKAQRDIILMDAEGRSLLTMRRNRPMSLRSQWQGFFGEHKNWDDQRPIFRVRLPLLFGKKKTKVDVFTRSDEASGLLIRGSFSKRSCTVYSRSGSIVAEVKRKQARSDVMLEDDVFSLVVQPGYDPAIVMGLIIVLDQV